MITIREIAQRAGVSIGTVDRVLHKRGRVAKATREKIERIIGESGYKPNLFASQLSLSRNYTFAVLVPKPEQDSQYWELPLKGMKQAESELQPYKIRVRYFFYDKYSESSFWREADKILSHIKEFHGLLIAPVLSKAAEPFISQIPPTLPYVFIDSYLPNTDSLSFIGQNSFRSGLLAGKLMHMLTLGKGTIVAFRLIPQDYHLDDRVNGFLSYFERYPSIQVKTFEANKQEDEWVFKHLMEKICKEISDIRGVFVPSASVHQVAEYIVQNCYEPKIHIIGYDLVEANLSFLQNGVIDFLIGQRPEMQGYQGIYALYKHVFLKHPVKKTMMLPLDIVTKENLEDYTETERSLIS